VTTTSISRLIGVATVVVTGLVAPAVAQLGLEGDEFQVNTYTTNAQILPDVAHIGEGEFVVVWTSYGPDGSSGGIAAQRFRANGQPGGNELLVNTYTTSGQTQPAIDADANGRFTVVWTNTATQDGSEYGIFGQRYSATGGKRGGEFQINEFTSGTQWHPDVGVAADGTFVVVWQDEDGRDGFADGIFGRRFANNGDALGADFQVNSTTQRDQQYPTLSVGADGSFVVAFTSLGKDDSSAAAESGIFARRFDSSGAPLGNEFQVNVFTTGDQTLPDVAMQPSGGFIVVWQDHEQVGAPGIFGRLYDATGAPEGSEFDIPENVGTTKERPRVATGSDGSFTVAWESSPQDGSSRGMFARRFAADATPLSAEFQVNSFTIGSQYQAAISSDGAEEVVVVWQSPQDGRADGIFGQRLNTDVVASGTCGDPISFAASTAARSFSGAAVTASDALATLQAAVGLLSCQLCVCDVNGSNTLSSTDALIILQFAVGQSIPLNCPAC
jgi:hypothetical protein